MPIKMQAELYGIPLEAHIRMVGVDIREVGEFDNGEKKYEANALLNYHTDLAQEKQYKQETEKLENLTISDLSLEQIYGKIMNLEKFQGSVFY